MTKTQQLVEALLASTSSENIAWSHRADIISNESYTTKLAGYEVWVSRWLGLKVYEYQLVISADDGGMGKVKFVLRHGDNGVLLDELYDAARAHFLRNNNKAMDDVLAELAKLKR